MSSIMDILSGLFNGFWDSIAGMKLLLYIDNEIHEMEEKKDEDLYSRREKENQRRRTPSPTPSSASALEREERDKTAQLRRQQLNNSDERTLASMRQSSKPQEQKKPKREKKIAKKVLKCCLLNGGFTWLSIILFEYVLLPVLRLILGLFYGDKSDDLHSVWSWLQPILTIIFSMMWVLPIFLLSKIVSSLWFQDIANAAYRVKKGRPSLIPSFSRLIADFLFSLIVQFIFLMQSMAVNLFPIMYIGQFLSFIHLSMLYSLYCFEYKWFNMGWELHKRLTYIEDNWPYFLGFGIPLTILTSMTNSVIVSGCIFSMFFPLFILSGNEARVITDTTNIPLRLFVPTIFVSNLFFSRSEDRKRIQENQLAKEKLQKQMLQYERYLKQKKPQRMVEPTLTLEERFQLHQMQEDLARRSAMLKRQQEEEEKKKRKPSPSISGSTASSSYRYQQPPPFSRPNSRSGDSDKSETGFVGMRPLIPTPVHHAAAGSTTNAQ